MKLEPLRGARFGIGTALIFAAITPINNLLRHEPISLGKIVIGAAFAFCVFGLIGTLTGKLGSDVGDA